MKRVEAIRQRITAVPQGVWEVSSYTNYVGYGIYAPNVGCIAERWWPSETDLPIRDIAALIASAPADLTYLLDRLERAESKIEHLLSLPVFKRNLASCMCTTCIVAEEARKFLSEEA